MIDWLLEHWFIEAVVYILASFLIGIIIGKAIKFGNGDDD